MGPGANFNHTQTHSQARALAVRTAISWFANARLIPPWTLSAGMPLRPPRSGSPYRAR